MEEILDNKKPKQGYISTKQVPLNFKQQQQKDDVIEVEHK